MSVDIKITAGDDFILDFLVLDENNDPVADLLGATAELSIKARMLDSEETYSTSAVISPSTGAIQFTVPDTVTETFLADGDMKQTYVYGTKITYSDGIEESPVSGRLMVFRGVVNNG